MKASFMPLFIALLVAGVSSPFTGYGQENAKPAKTASKHRPKKKRKKKEEPPKEEEQKTLAEKAIHTGNVIEKGVDKAAEKIDIALAGKKYTKKRNESRVNITELVTWREGGHVKNSADFGINLRLPNLEKKWQVRFTSYDEREESRNLQQRRLRTQPRRRDYGAALLFFKRLGKVRTSFQPRLALKDPLEMSYVLRFESEAENKSTRLAPRFELFADPEKGTGEFLSLEFNHDLGKKWGLSLQAEEEYRERGNYFVSNNGITFEYQLTDNKGLGFSYLTGSNNKSRFHLESYSFSTAFVHEVVHERLKYFVTPFLAFTKPEHFKGDAGISLNTELSF